MKLHTPRLGAAKPRGLAALAAGALIPLAMALTSLPVAAIAPPSACVVNSTADGAWGGGGTCETAIPGQVTLRSAVQAENSLGAGSHAITFNLPNPSVITLGTQLQVTAGTLTITGPGTRALALDGNGGDRIFDTNDPTVSLSLTGLTLRNGHPDGDGGAIEAFGPLSLDHVAVTGNSGSGGGGILFNCNCPLTITNSTISGNTAATAAGLDIAASTANLTNVTVANNLNTSGNEASGIEIDQGALNLNFVTVAGNTYQGTPSASNLPVAGIGVHGTSVDLRGHVFFHNSIVANNMGANCRFGGDTNGDTPGLSTDQGYNLDSGNDCGFSAGGPKFDQVKANPQLGALANNGGPTNTMALGAGSLAINRADPACSVATDQRGISRPQGSRCDIGAFEVLAAVASPSPSATPVLPRAGRQGAAPAGGVALVLVAFAAFSVLTLVRVLRPRTGPRD